MPRSKDLPNGFALIEALVIAVILVIIGAVGWLVYHHHKKPASHQSSASSIQPGQVKPSASCTSNTTNPVPLIDLTTGCFDGYQGGLYPEGVNTPPSSYLSLGLSAAAKVRPLDASGNPSSDGKIVLVSIGMSNVLDNTQGFIRQVQADHALNPGKANMSASAGSFITLDNGRVEIVDGGVSNYDGTKMVADQSTYLGLVDQDVANAGASNNQVEAVWMEEALANPTHMTFLGYSQQLQKDLEAIVNMLEGHYPNLKLIYISSREYGGYALNTTNPEPYAYYSGFADKWAIADYINNKQAQPWVAWGPYLWANGTTPNSQGLTWQRSDFAPNGLHPSASGMAKTGTALLNF